MPDKVYLKHMFLARMGKRLDLEHPRTYNEKLQWMKLYDRKPEYSMMVDKYDVKTYVSAIIGQDHIIPMLGVWDSFDEIDFDKLPKRFVLKCTHDSGGHVICKDKDHLDLAAARKTLSSRLKRNYYKLYREWPYKDVKPRIIAEAYMEDAEGKGDLTDYKLHFFNGECKAILEYSNRFGTNGAYKDYYTPDWQHMDFLKGPSSYAPERSRRPVEMDEMIELGRLIAKNYLAVRVDFYIINHRIYFGEITFFPAGGFCAFDPEEWDEVFGGWIHLPTDT